MLRCVGARPVFYCIGPADFGRSYQIEHKEHDEMRYRRCKIQAEVVSDRGSGFLGTYQRVPMVNIVLRNGVVIRGSDAGDQLRESVGQWII